MGPDGDYFHVPPYFPSERPSAWDERDDDPKPEPGTDCPTCDRRVPLPKTDKTPPTKVKGFRVPTDEWDALNDVLGEASKHLGCYDRAYPDFKTISLALYLVLQDDKLKGFAQKRPQ